MPIKPEQVKAARLLVGWTRVKLAFRVGVSETSIAFFEEGIRIPSVLKLSVIHEVLESAGVIFVEENGEGPRVRLRKTAK